MHAAILLVLVFIAASFGLYHYTSHEGSKRIVAFCGSASKPALQDAAENFEKRTGIEVELHFSGSGTMLSEMETSQKGDLYISGSPDYMVRAVDDNVVYPEIVEKIAYLVPAIVTPKGNPENVSSLADLSGQGVEIGIGDPKSVCVGEYAVEVLENNHLFEEVKNNIETHAKSCSQTASLAVVGKVDAIIGWRVFHFWHPEKTEIVYIEPDRIPKIAFIPAAISQYTNNRKRAQQFINYLTSPIGKQVFQNYDYIATENKARNLATQAKIIEIGK